MSKLSAAGLAMCVALLGGCALAPGQQMDTAAMADQHGKSGSRIQLVPITPKLIAMENADRTQAVIPQALLDFRPSKYKIGAGDVLFITVWDHPELTAPSGPQQQIFANGRLVRPDGTLYYPYIGNVAVAGLDLDQVRQQLSKHLAEYVQEPQIDVNVITFASQRVWLNGAFRDTGTQPITVTPLTLAEALGKAQVDSTQANLSDLTLQRDGVDYHLDLDAMRHGLHGPADIYLKDGDHLYLGYNDRQQVYLMGEVTQPRALTFKTSDMSLTQALGNVGGLNQNTSKGRAVYVIRGVADLEQTPATVYQLDVHSPSALVLADNFKLHAGDVVYVGAAGVTRWNRLLSQLLPMSAILNQSAAARNNLSQ